MAKARRIRMHTDIICGYPTEHLHRTSKNINAPTLRLEGGSTDGGLAVPVKHVLHEALGVSLCVQTARHLWVKTLWHLFAFRQRPCTLSKCLRRPANPRRPRLLHRLPLGLRRRRGPLRDRHGSTGLRCCRLLHSLRHGENGDPGPGGEVNKQEALTKRGAKERMIRN